jgi:thymidylate synthase
MFGHTPGQPICITSRGLEGAWDQAIRTIWTSGDRKIDQRRNKIREILNMTIHITGTHNDYPKDCPCGNKYGVDFAKGLLDRECAMSKANEFDYSYGERIRRNGSLENTIEILRNEPESRTCVLPVYMPADTNTARERATGVSTVEVPCMIVSTVILRDDRLHMNLVARSNDVLMAMPSDIYGFRALQQMIADKVGTKVGSFTHHILFSAHIIEENGSDFMNNYMKR